MSHNAPTEYFDKSPRYSAGNGGGTICRLGSVRICADCDVLKKRNENQHMEN